MASIYAQLDQAAAAEVGGGVKALALQTSSPIYSNAVSSQAVVSYLIIGIPMLAYSLANRLVNFGSAIMGGLQGLQSASLSGNASAAAAAGNASMGNVSMDQRVVSPSTSNPWVSRQQDMDGNWLTTTGSGQQAVSYLRNEGAVSRVVSSRVSQSAVSEASRAAESARSDVVSASSELSSSLVDSHVARVIPLPVLEPVEWTAPFPVSKNLASRLIGLRAISDQVSSTTGLTSAQVAQIAFQLVRRRWHARNQPDQGERDRHRRQGLQHQPDGSRAEGGELSLRTISCGSSSHSLTERAREQSYVSALGKEDRDGQELASRLSSATTRVESAQSVYAERQAVANRLSTAYESGEALSIDLAQLPANSDFMQRYQRLAAEYGPNSLALQAAMASELATRALPPTKRPVGFLRCRRPLMTSWA